MLLTAAAWPELLQSQHILQPNETNPGEKSFQDLQAQSNGLMHEYQQVRPPQTAAIADVPAMTWASTNAPAISTGIAAG